MKELWVADGSLGESKFSVARLRASWFAVEDGGQSLIEFALTAPLLLLIVTGIITFGLAMNNYVTLQEATSVGARYLALSRQQGGDPCATTASMIGAAAPGLKNTGSASTGLNYTFTVAGNASPYTGTAPTCPSATFTQSTPVTVKVTYPCTISVFKWTNKSGTTGGNLAPTCLLTAQTSEVTQ